MTFFMLKLQAKT